MTLASTRRLQQTSLIYGVILLLSLVSQPSNPAEEAVMFLTLLGLIATAAACLGRIWCSVFIAGRKDQELVTTGPYALCRHPLYALSMLGGLGIALATLSFSLGIALLSGLGWLLRRAAVTEERVLAARFGDEYVAYRARTPAFWPGALWPNERGVNDSIIIGSTINDSLINDSASPVIVYPAILWKAFLDAGSFFLLFACIVLARQISLVFPITPWVLW